MIPAVTSKRRGNNTKLLVLAAQNKTIHTTVNDFTKLLSPGDLLVVNQSATLPSSFSGRVKRTGESVEIRLAAFQGPTVYDLQNWLAISFGSGDWKMPTENRGRPPKFQRGDQVLIGPGLSAEIVDCQYDRLLRICFHSSDLAANLYRYGKPIQYSYLTEELQVWDQQTLFSGPPISVEPPSASFPFTWDLMFSFRERGLKMAALVHGAGISSTGSEVIDSLLPLREWYSISEELSESFNKAKKDNNKIVALGTSVLRALESSWNGHTLRPGSGLTELKITPEYQIQSVNSLITGMHEVGTSHRNILNSICPIEHMRRSYEEALQRGYLGHEYGDLSYLDCKESHLSYEEGINLPQLRR